MSDFIAMGGYAFYVWMSYGVTALLVAVEVFLVLRKQRTIRQQLARAQRLNDLLSEKAGGKQ